MKTLRARTKKITLLSVLAAMLIACVAVFVCQTTTKAEAAEKSGEEPQITLVGANVSLDDSINIVYAAAVKGYDYTKYKTKLLVWTAWQDEYTKDNCDIIVDSSYHQNLSAGSVVYSCDMFYYGVPAKKIVDQLYVKAYVEIDGKEVYSDTLKYSVLDYLYRMLGKTGITDYERRMYEAILKYGGRAQDLLNYLRNRRADDTFYSIHVENGTLSDGFTRGLFLENEEVVMTANAAPEGKKFAYWQDANGIILGYDDVLTVKATAANTYTAVFVDKITVSEQLHLTCSVSYDDKVEAVDLPDVINIKDDAGNITSSINVTWDVTQFVSGKIGEQVLTATPKTEADKAALGSETVTMTVTVMPYSFQVDTVTGNYHITKYHNEANESRVLIPEKYRGQDIDTIDNLAFNAALSITDLYIPDTITKIAKGAFNACDNIETIRIPFIGDSMSTSNIFGYIFGTDSYESQKAFVPINLHKVIISDNVTAIRNYAFYGCKQITDIELPGELKRIGDSAFSGVSVDEVVFPDSLNYVDGSVFRNCERLKKISVSSLNKFLSISFNGFGMFDGSSNVYLYLNGKQAENIVIPEGTTASLSGKFAGFAGIKKVTIPDSVTDINFTFYENADLEEVVFTGESKIQEFDCTFDECSSLKTITIPSSVTAFKQDAFCGCTALKTVYYDGSFEDWLNVTMGRESSSPMPYTEKFYYKKENGYEELIDAVIPESITQINMGIFSGYKALRSVTFHNGVLSIAKEAFKDCENLTSVVLPSQLRFLGEYAFYNCKSLYSINIPQTLNEIGSNAFYNCYNLAEVYNCSSMEFTIGSDSYGYVAKYAKVIHTDMSEPSCIIYDGDYVMCKVDSDYILFDYRGNDTELVLPDKITIIDKELFYRNKNITSVVIPEGVTTIGDSAFSGSTLSCISIPSSVITIGASAFQYCTSLTSVELSGGAPEIGDYAFYECKNLCEVVNKSELNIKVGSTNYGYIAYYAQKVLTADDEKGEFFSVGKYSFYKQGGEYILYAYNGTDSETEIILPEDVDNGHTYAVGRNVFYYNRRITSVTLPSSLTEIKNTAFYECNNLVEVINNSNLNIVAGSSDNGYVAYYAQKVLNGNEQKGEVFAVGDFSFYKNGDEYILYKYTGPSSVTTVTLPSLSEVGHAYKIGRKVFYGKNNIVKVTIPSCVTGIGEWAFYGCTSLTSIVIPESVTMIEGYAFRNTSLTSVVIPTSVTIIGENAFYDCTSLTSIVIPEGVTEIGRYAFGNCTSLTSVVIPTSVTIIREYAFADCTSLTSVEFKNPEGWKRGSAAISAEDLQNTSTAAQYLTSKYRYYTWTREDKESN